LCEGDWEEGGAGGRRGGSEDVRGQTQRRCDAERREQGCWEGMEAEQQRKKTKRFFCTQPKKKPQPGSDGQNDLDGTGDSVG